MAFLLLHNYMDFIAHPYNKTIENKKTLITNNKILDLTLETIKEIKEKNQTKKHSLMN